MFSHQVTFAVVKCSLLKGNNENHENVTAENISYSTVIGIINTVGQKQYPRGFDALRQTRF